MRDKLKNNKNLMLATEIIQQQSAATRCVSGLKVQRTAAN
jgi:hypothetical protein